MKLLIILFTTFVLGLLATRIFLGLWDFRFSGNLGMAAFLIFTGSAHFRFQKGMAMMIPDVVPGKLLWVYATGILEIAAGIGLMITSIRYVTAVLLIIFFILVFAANINSSKKKKCQPLQSRLFRTRDELSVPGTGADAAYSYPLDMVFRYISIIDLTF